jgi:Leucine-rich repeat (LRR) protein
VEIQHLKSLRKVDLSSNGIHFLPDRDKMAELKNLEYLQLHKNLLVGWR